MRTLKEHSKRSNNIVITGRLTCRVGGRLFVYQRLSYWNTPREYSNTVNRARDFNCRFTYRKCTYMLFSPYQSSWFTLCFLNKSSLKFWPKSKPERFKATNHFYTPWNIIWCQDTHPITYKHHIGVHTLNNYTVNLARTVSSSTYN